MMLGKGIHSQDVQTEAEMETRRAQSCQMKFPIRRGDRGERHSIRYVAGLLGPALDGDGGGVLREEGIGDHKSREARVIRALNPGDGQRGRYWYRTKGWRKGLQPSSIKATYDMNLNLITVDLSLFRLNSQRQSNKPPTYTHSF